MKITGKNITAIIEYLYEKRLNQKASPEVLQSWTNLSDDEARLHLTQLFQSWGFSADQIIDELNDFAAQEQGHSQTANNAYQASVNEYRQPQAAPIANSTTQSNYQPPRTNTTPPPKKSSRTWLWLVLLPLLAVGGYALYKFQQFKNLHYIYVTTDNVSIRNHEGENIGRMDIFANANSVSFLRTTDANSYPITVGDNVYQCRKVVFDSTSFLSYLLNKPESFGYVNENYVIDDKENFIIYRNVFKAINNVKNENAALTSPFRKVIVGSLRQNPSLENLFIQNTCGNKDKNLTSLIKHKTTKGVHQVVALLSDGNYYVFTGDPANNQYAAPVPFQYQNSLDNSIRPFANENILFKYVNKTYFLFSCDGTARDYYTVFDENGMISYAKYSFEP